VGCLWMQLFMAVPMTPSAAVADFGGRRYRRFIPFNFGSSPPPWRPCSCHQFIAGVIVTGDKVIAGVVVTGDKLFTGINDTGDHCKSVTKINRRCR
jgi:hypothetical protein